jgi:hypothetical protein
MEHTIYLVCAIAGCTLVGLQVLLQVLGIFGDLDADAGDADVDVDTDVDHDGVDGHGNLFFGILSFKALCAFAGIFGLVGLMLIDSDISMVGRVAAACGSGAVGMLLVAWMMRGISRLQASGSLDIRNAVGKSGTVYLPIPGQNGGRGKVTLTIQGRSIELPAHTEGEAIESGKRVTVVSVESDESVKVVPA